MRPILNVFLVWIALSLSALGATTGGDSGGSGSGSYNFNTDQFSIGAATNVYIKSGALLTNVTYNALTASRALGLDGSKVVTDTFASAALLGSLSDETGTGAAVFGTSPTISTKLTLSGATETSSNPVLDASQTWNSGGTTFTGMKLNITDTASASGSLLMDLQVGASSKFSVNKSGFVTAIIYDTGVVRADANGLSVGSGARVAFSAASHPSGGSIDTVLVRDAANTLAQRNGTSAQTLRVYGSFTDTSNYQRGIIQTFSGGNGDVRLRPEHAGTGASGALVLGSAATDRWRINTSGHMLAESDNAYDIGASGVSRPRTAYLGTGLITPRIVEAKTADYPVTANDSNKAFTNEGTTAKRNNTLPSAAAGLQYTFIVQDTDGVTVTAAAGDTIRIAASVSGTAGNIDSTTVGNTVTLLAINATEWIATSVNGTWTVSP